MVVRAAADVTNRADSDCFGMRTIAVDSLSLNLGHMNHPRAVVQLFSIISGEFGSHMGFSFAMLGNIRCDIERSRALIGRMVIKRSASVLVFVVLALLFTSRVTFAAAEPEAKDRAAGCCVKYGFIDKSGKILFLLNDAIPGEFSEGLALVRSEAWPQKPYSYIDRKGAIQFTVESDGPPGSFHNGLAVVNRTGGYGFIDRKGHTVIPCQFDYAWSFLDGRAEVVLRGTAGERAAIDRQGKIIERLPKEKLSDYFPSDSIVEKDYKGRLSVVLSTLDTNNVRRSHFSEGLAWIHFKNNDNKDTLAYMDSTKHVSFILDSSIEQAGDFHEGLAPVVFKVVTHKGEACAYAPHLGFIDKTGKVVIGPKFDNTNPHAVRFSDGVALGCSHGYACFIDRRGTEIARFV